MGDDNYSGDGKIRGGVLLCYGTGIRFIFKQSGLIDSCFLALFMNSIQNHGFLAQYMPATKALFASLFGLKSVGFEDPILLHW